jgi:isoamylase
LRMGDEIRRTQHGNNNAYCIDDATTWFDWSGLAKHAELHRFVKQLIAFRNASMLPREPHQMTLNELIAEYRIEWHGIALGEPDWSDTSHSVAATFHFDRVRLVLHLMINAYWEPLTFAIPRLDQQHDPWRRSVDTAREAPGDICGWTDADVVSAGTLIVQPRSIVVLVTRAKSAETQSY